jgi:hypothetical protein
VRGKLEEGWAYILRGDRPLSLAPVVAYGPKQGGERIDVYMADQVDVAGTKPVTVVSVSDGEKKKVARAG